MSHVGPTDRLLYTEATRSVKRIQIRVVFLKERSPSGGWKAETGAIFGARYFAAPYGEVAGSRLKWLQE